MLQVLELSLWAKSPAQVCLFELSKICYLSNHSWRYRHNLHNIILGLLYLLSIGFRFNTSESIPKPSTHSYKILMQNSLSISLIIEVKIWVNFERTVMMHLWVSGMFASMFVATFHWLSMSRIWKLSIRTRPMVNFFSPFFLVSFENWCFFDLPRVKVSEIQANKLVFVKRRYKRYQCGL